MVVIYHFNEEFFTKIYKENIKTKKKQNNNNNIRYFKV